jgi:Flp pilus assembly pilin Flp
MMPRLSHWRRIRRDNRGAAALEFAFVAPIMILMLMGLLDMGHQIYVQAVLEGEMQKAARDSALESGVTNSTAIDTKVKNAVLNVAASATFAVTRKSYSNFNDVGQPEDYTDTNGNGTHDSGECFEDVNGNGQWDSDLGKTGLGGADDVVMYTVRVTYPELFPLSSLMGMSSTKHTEATAILRNQPYNDQALPVFVACS